MKIAITHTYTVCDAYLPYLINGSTDNLTDAEIEALENFKDYVQDQHGIGHWSCIDDDPYFSLCDISTLMANCVDIQWVEMGK